MGHFKLEEVFAATQARHLPSTLQTIEDVALASSGEIPVKKDYEYISAARVFLAKKLVRRIARNGDVVHVVLKHRVDYPPEMAKRLFRSIAAQFVRVYQPEKMSFTKATDIEYQYSGKGLELFEHMEFEKFTEVTFDEIPVTEAETEVQAQVAIPDDIFGSIIGYDDAKTWVRRSLETDKPVHILFVGPPASSKTLFLLEIERAFGPRAKYALGGGATKAGVAEVLFAEKPQFLLVDELDKMGVEDYSVLLSLCETGIVSETKYGKTRQTKLDTRVYAAANRIDKIPQELLSRFMKFHFQQYSRDEFAEVVLHVLTKMESAPPELATHIAERLSAHPARFDVRDAIRAARLAKSNDEVDRLLDALGRYGAR